MKLDKKHSTIAPHLQNLDSLCYENIEHNKQKKIDPYKKFKYKDSNCSVIIRKRQTHTDLMEYLHASCFGPVKSTFIKAIKKVFFNLAWIIRKISVKTSSPTNCNCKGPPSTVATKFTIHQNIASG